MYNDDIFIGQSYVSLHKQIKITYVTRSSPALPTLRISSQVYITNIKTCFVVQAKITHASNFV